MKLPASTGWVLHVATALAQLDPGQQASAARLAEHFDLPARRARTRDAPRLLAFDHGQDNRD